MSKFAINLDHHLVKGLEAFGGNDTIDIMSQQQNFMMPYGHFLALRNLVEASAAVATGNKHLQAVIANVRQKFKLENQKCPI